MFIHRKLTTTCCVAVLALGLVACGSSDDDTSMPDPTAMEPMEPAAAAQLANAQAAVADAETMVEVLNDDSSSLDRAAAYTALGAAEMALAEASEIPENEIALLEEKIARLQEIIDQAATVAQAKADRIADEMTAEAKRIADLVAGTKEAETKRDAIDNEAGAMAAADVGFGGIDGGTYSMTITRDRDGTIVKIADTLIMGEDDPKFMKVMDLGNGRTMHTRTMDADPDGNVVTEVVIVSTDIDAPTATAFAKVPEQMLNASTDDDAGMNSLTVIETNFALVMSAAFFAAGTDSGVTHDFNAAVMNADTPDRDAASVPGTYNGAMGTYTCSGVMDCTVSVDDEGMLTAISAGWIFTPAMGATSDVPDADYLNYGFWLMKTTDDEDMLTYNQVQTFAGSSVAASDSVVGVTGSATYNGGATGVYVHSEVNSDGSRVGTTAGQFAADATLTATFGQVLVPGTAIGTIAQNLLNKVTGSISNFELENDEEQQWSVNLKGDIVREGGDVPAGTADGGGADGSFSATFHGPTANNVQPSSVVGEFDANFNNGSVAGAFGASK